METINCCIVGYEGIAEFHAEALTRIEGARIHSIVGRREELFGGLRQKARGGQLEHGSRDRPGRS